MLTSAMRMLSPEDLAFGSMQIGGSYQILLAAISHLHASKRAREERALAAERRFKAPQGAWRIVSEQLSLIAPPIAPKKEQSSSSETESETESDSGAEGMETDEKRREWMRKSMKDDDLKSSKQFMRDFLSGSSSSRPSTSGRSEGPDYSKLFEAIEISDDEDEEPRCDIPSTSNPVNPTRPNENPPGDRPSKRQKTMPSESNSGPSGSSLGLGRIVQEEIATRKRESLGLVGERKLGTGIRPVSKLKGSSPAPVKKTTPASTTAAAQEPEWACQVCTL